MSYIFFAAPAGSGRVIFFFAAPAGSGRVMIFFRGAGWIGECYIFRGAGLEGVCHNFFRGSSGQRACHNFFGAKMKIITRPKINYDMPRALVLTVQSVQGLNSPVRPGA